MTDHKDVTMEMKGVDNGAFDGDTHSRSELRHSFKEHNSNPSVEDSDEEDEGGCHVGAKSGCCLVITAIAMAALVGILVYFLHPDKGKVAAPAPTNLPSVRTSLPSSVTSSPDVTTTLPPVDVRLRLNILPELYIIRLHPDFYGSNPDTFKFSGDVIIDVVVKHATEVITLHTKQLNVTSNNLKVEEKDNGVAVSILKTEYEETKEFFHITLDNQLDTAKKYTISMSFAGRLSDDLLGIYYSRYTDGEGQEEYLLTSQLQATDARKVFPCFDEPAIKAKFQVSIERKMGFISLGNTNIEKTEAVPGMSGWEVDLYATSPKMSTYLLAFMVSKFRCISADTRTGTQVEICARSNAIKQAEYALQVAVPMQEYYEWYHDIPYPLPKTTHVAIPDFAAGAMENWGLIMYRETALLYDAKSTSASAKQWVTIVIAHELAHMWFGNLVTPQWWDDIWLNEGFASWMENLCTENVTGGDWQMEPQFVANDMQYVMRMDGLLTSHPVYQPVNHPSEIDALFDTITYSKGAAVIRMMQHFLGADVFRWGLSSYLKDLSYSAAHHDDLFTALTKRANTKDLNVTHIMYTWIRQMGYPVVNVRYNKNNGDLELSQKHFLLDPSKISERPPSEFGYIWHVPITVEGKRKPGVAMTPEVPVSWLTTRQHTFEAVLDQGYQWVLLNVKQQYYYRVNYEKELWDALIDQLNTDHTEITYVENRAQIIDDAFSLGRAGEIDQLTALRTTEYLDTETQYVPWIAAIDNMGYLDSMLELSHTYNYFQTYMRRLTAGHHDRLGWNDDLENDPHIEQRFRRLIIGQACYYGVESCVRSANAAFSKWMNDPVKNSVSANLQVYVYCNGIRYGGSKEWNFVYDKYKTSTDSTEQDTFLRALACTRQADLLNGFMQRALDGAIRRQDFRSVVIQVSRNPNGRALAWTFFRANWRKFFEVLSWSAYNFGRVITGVTGSFSTPWELKELRDFKDIVGKIGSVEYAFDQAIETANINLAWKTANEKDITDWLKSKSEELIDPPVVTDIRLEKNIMPVHYDLTIRPDIYSANPDNFSFSGKVTILVDVKETMQRVTLHYKKLTISEDAIRVKEESSGDTVNVMSASYEKERDFYHIDLSTSLMMGKRYTIYLEFTGPLTNDLAGIYTSSYVDGDGKKQYILASQLQATDARKVFPCFDEPALKATFKVTIDRKEPFTSFSNTQIEASVDKGNGWIGDVYQMTPKMSTYLLAFVVSTFECKADQYDGKTVELCARKELIDQVEYARTFAMEMQKYFEVYHDIPYPLNKTGHVAIPDFASGAMENWGLILYREYALLYDAQSTDVRYKQYLTYVVAHELAHMWFGNLVSPTWWDDIWLNEGFASWMMTACTDASFPEWKMEEQFVVVELQKVMAIDGLVSSHPVYQPVNHPNEISSLFDTITYSKGSTVIRMMKHFLGDDAFRWGLSKYLKELAYIDATHNDLFNTLTEVAAEYGRDINVTNVMYTWIIQMGYPVLHVSYNKTTGEISLRQEHFLLDPSKDEEKPDSPFNYEWEVPLTVVTNLDNADSWEGGVPRWLSLTTGSIGTTVGADWILMNPGVPYYYRTNYDAAMWDAIIDVLNTNHKVIIKQQNRAQLIDDAFALGRGGYIDQVVSLRITEYLDKEEEYVPWLSGVNNMGYIDKMLELSSTYSNLKKYMQMKLEPLHTKLGWEEDVTSDPHLEQRLRYTLLAEACHYGLPSCVTQSTDIFSAWMEDPINNRVSPNLQNAVYCNGVRYGGAAEWNFVLTRYKVAESAAQGANFITAMSCSREADILNTYLHKALAEEIRRGDFAKVISAVAANPSGRALAWNFLRSQWGVIYAKYGTSTFAFTDIVTGVTGSFSSAFELQELETFKAGLADLGTAANAFKQAIEKVAINVEWRAANELKISEWLKEKTGQIDVKPDSVDVRLPDTIKPIRYWVRVRPDIYQPHPDAFGFNGTSRVEIEVLKSTTTIALHGRSLVVDDKDWSLYDSAMSEINLAKIEYDDAREFFVLTAAVELVAGNRYYVDVKKYTGPVDDTLLGIYWSSYTTNGTTEYLLASQLQATHARKVFPCFDEPGVKAKFNITMEYMAAKDFTSKGNTDVWWKEDLAGGWAADHYSETPVMSTYLLAFVISKFQCLQSQTKEGIEVEICARPYLISQAEFANSFSADMQDYYVDYFGIKYPLPRMTHAGLPDFAFGAMENWGLILYRESAILYDPNSSSAANRQRVAIIIAHELAHQWFGNLVTPQWWDDLWLNEGFASWMEILCTASVFPDWNMDDQFVVEDVQRVMRLDGLVTSHPVYQPVNDPGEIDALFDTITYSKGASVNRMMYYFLGEDIFRNGLAAYLNERSYQSAFHDQLFGTLTRVANDDYSNPINVTKVMHTWIKQMGYPVVNVEYNSVTGQVTLVQKHFLLDPSKISERPQSEYGYLWEIPFTCITNMDTDDKWVNPEISWFNTETTTLSCTDGGDWVLGNVGERMYYRVNYDENNWQRLIGALKEDPTKIKSQANRAQIIDDAFSLGRAGELDQLVAMQVTEYLDLETEYVPWYAASVNLGYVKRMLQLSSVYGDFKRYMRLKTQPHLDTLGWGEVESKKHIDERMRQLIVSQACSYAVDNCVNNASQLFAGWMDNVKNGKPNTILADLRSTTYCTAMSNGGVQEWEFIFEQYPNAESANEGANIISALACTSHAYLLNSYLERALAAEIRLQDFRTVIVSVSENPNGRALAWNFLRANWAKIRAQFGDSPFTLSRMIEGVTKSFSTDWELQELRSFKDSVSDAGSAVFAFKQAMETTSINIAWRKANEANIAAWLRYTLT